MNTCKRCGHETVKAPTSTEVKALKACACECHTAWRLVNVYPTPKPPKAAVAKKAPAKKQPAKKAAPRKRAVKS